MDIQMEDCLLNYCGKNPNKPTQIEAFFGIKIRPSQQIKRVPQKEFSNKHDKPGLEYDCWHLTGYR